nr:hypothetical protein [Haliscomenobacter sp.]
MLYRRRQFDYRQRFAQLRYAIRLNRDYAAEQLSRDIYTVIFAQR